MIVAKNIVKIQMFFVGSRKSNSDDSFKYPRRKAAFNLIKSYLIFWEFDTFCYRVQNTTLSNLWMLSHVLSWRTFERVRPSNKIRLKLKSYEQIMNDIFFTYSGVSKFSAKPFDKSFFVIIKSSNVII